MEDEDKYSKKSLHQFSYRYLQKLAKSMSLPCNVKKVYLVELIRAKKFSSESEVSCIVQRVKRERQQLADLRKSYHKGNLKSNEIYYKKPHSPPITTTPKRSSTPNLQQAVIKYKPKSNLAHVTQRTYCSPKLQNGSDRVLRSFNLKSMSRKTGIFNVNNAVVGITKTHNRVSPQEAQIEIVSQEGNLPKSKLTAKCFVKKQKPTTLGSTNSDSNKMYDSKMMLQANHKTGSPPSKRQRTVSGIYPLVPKEPTEYGYLQCVGLKGKDGKISKIHALVHKRSTSTENYEVINFRKPVINFQEGQTQAQSNLMEFVTDHTVNNNNYLQLQYPITAIEKEIESNLIDSDQINLRSNEAIEDMHSVYYHKKIRAEQVRYNRIFDTREIINDRLPKINEAFAQFKDPTQPLYVQVSDSETVDMHQMYPRNNANCAILEPMYNIRREYLINQPLLQIATTSNTKCVFSTSIIATPRAQPASTFVVGEPNVASGESVGGSDRVTSLYTQESVSPEPACASIPEMVEDALEIISQDGDYLERIGMDMRTQCVLCSWAGPMVMLQYHLTKDHSEQIYRQIDSEWNITFTLGSLVQCHMCLSQIVEYESTLYILSARYEDPDCFMASISTLTPEPSEQRIGSITTYNKVTGEPHLWQGSIQPFQSHQYPLDGDCLKLELSQLNLLPNSANLKLLNRELVNNSPYKVVIGQPELNDIHIILFINILN